MIEQIPLVVELDDRMMVCPASGFRLFHDDSLVFVRSHRIVAHGVCQTLRAFLLAHPRIGKVELSVTLKGERPFFETFWQVGYALRLAFDAQKVV